MPSAVHSSNNPQFTIHCGVSVGKLPSFLVLDRDTSYGSFLNMRVAAVGTSRS